MSRRSPKPQTLPKPIASPQMENKASPEKRKKLPPWIDALLWTRFFQRCSSHAQWYGTHRRCPAKNGCNILCIDCCVAICSRCTQEEHHGHRTVQIRVSSCQNAVKVTDIKPFLDVAKVQTYMIGGFPVVCIKRKPKTPGRWPGSVIDPGSTTCKVCSRVLRGIYTFCSIECKVCDYASAQGQTLEATMTMSKATVTVSGARKRARKATPQRAHLGCTL